MLQTLTGLVLCLCRDCKDRRTDELPRPKPAVTLPTRSSTPTLDEVRAKADRILRAARLEPHPYLAAKGFPQRRGLVERGRLIVPMRDARHRLRGLQTIDSDGWKKFLWGSRALDSACVIGHGITCAGQRWYVEGLATGLSVLAASAPADTVVVCFSAHNLSRVATWRPGIVIADHDMHKCRSCEHRWDAPYDPDAVCPECRSEDVLLPAGEKAARLTGRPYWVPPDPGDANDWHIARGLDRLRDDLHRVAY